MTRNLSILSRVSSLAIAAVLTAGAAAQSFQGTPSTAAGDVFISEGPGTTDIMLNTVQSVIDWDADDDAVGNFGAINFQPAGTTATFSSFQDFAVLNRISIADPTRIVALNGTITSQVGGQTGGSIFFYSPSGFVVTGTAIINVGSLVLSASPITVDVNNPDGNYFINSGQVVFGPALNPNAAINTGAGSQISANGVGSYVALVAPTITHQGSIRTDTAAALVAAEAATITFSPDGLFNIEVTTGTDAATGIHVDGGTITRTNPDNVGDHRAYLVAVPKNDAVTLLINNGGSVGFDTASSAGVEGNAVVLSAGYDISFGNTSGEPSAASGGDADISIGNAGFTTAVFGRANGEAVASSVAGSLTFSSDATFNARDLVKLEAGGGGNVSVGGNLLLSASATGSDEGESAVAGNVTLQAFAGGALSVAGSTDLRAVGTGGFSNTPGITTGDGTGGTILVQSTSSGTMSLGDDIFDTFTANATGQGGGYFSDGGFIDGGDGFGGTVNVFTSGGSSMNVAGTASLTADGIAGQPNDCFQCGGIGGVGDAGFVNVQAHTGPDNNMDFAGDLFINANGEGGDGQSGGLGLGGNVTVSALSQSSVTVGSGLFVSAFGEGGNAFGVDGDAGSGIGGVTDVAADNGSLAITGSHSQYLDGNGGFSEFGNGGDGQGGSGEMFANNDGTASVGLYSSIEANGNGGEGFASGGEGHGGLAYYSASNGGSLTLGSFSSLTADGRGGGAFDADGLGGNGGLGEGGHAEAYANGGVVDVQGTFLLSADGRGGSAGGLRDAGDSLGGDVFLQALNGGTFTIAGGLYATAVGVGDYINNLTNSGDGTGGTINIYSRDGDSTLTIAGDADLNADGEANRQGECFPCGGVGGIGQGGDITIASQGATGTNGNVLTFQAALDATANGYGGGGVGGAAGDGFGGSVRLSVAGGNTASVSGVATLEAQGWGGYDFAGLVGGNGTGGTAQIHTVAGNAANSMTLGGAIVDAGGWGGDSGTSTNGAGGDGTGGTAGMYSPAGTIHVIGDLTLDAQGYGGDSDGSAGIGGDGFGKLAELIADGGDITIDGSAFVDASGTGGDAFDAGDGFGGGDPDLPPEDQTDGAYVFARNGDISIGVDDVETGAFVESNGFGGNGLDNGLSGGGSGGNGSGGFVSMLSGNSNLGASSITAEMTFLSATGEGGDGGDGSGGGSGDPGGDGGTGTGGFVGQTAGAGNGLLDIGNAIVNVSALGGSGGDGGSADGGTGGDGGNGGAAIGGFSNVGTASHAPSIAQAGVGNFGSITIDASAVGGNGGNGGIFGLPDGNGGAGGSATSGTAVLLVRGSTVNVNSVGLISNATGGDGGSGATAGVGGDAETDEVGVLVTERFQGTTRGQLNAGSIIGTLTAVGGSGSTPGQSLAEGGSFFIIRNSDASIGSVDISSVADSLIPDLAEDAISIVNGDVTIANSFSFTTSGHLSLFADNGSMTADNLTLAASDFVHDTVNVTPAVPGTYFAGTASITTGNNFITTANLVVDGSLTINAPGLIEMANGTSNDGDVDLDAGSTIVAGNLTAAGSVDAQSGGSILTGDIGAGDFISLHANGGGISTGDLLAVTSIDLDADGDILFGDAQADDFDFSADGSVTGGNIIAGTNASGDAEGAVNLGNISVGILLTGGPAEQGFAVGMSSATSISVGDVEADESIGFATLGSLTAGNLNAGADVLTMVGGNTMIASITTPDTGRTYHGDVQMFLDAGGGDDNFDPSLVFGATPLRSGGSYTVTGPISTGRIQVAAASISTGDIIAPIGIYLDSLNGIMTGNLTSDGLVEGFSDGSILTGDIFGGTIDLFAGGDIATGAIDAVDFVELVAVNDIGTDDITAGGHLLVDSGGNQLLGNLSSGLDIDLVADGDVAFGNADAATEFDFDVGGNVTGGDIIAGAEIGGEGAGGSVTLGNLTAGFGQGEPEDTFSIGFAAGGSITVGNVLGANRVGFATLGDLTTGSINAGWDFMAAVGGDVSTGAITTGEGDRVYIANVSMYLDATEGGELDFDPDIVLALDPVPTGGSITIGGPVSTGQFQAAAGADLNTGQITAQSIHGSAGGTATISGLWSASSVDLASNDINILATGGINAGPTGSVALFSTNATQALIGDGLTGTGYALSNAEFGRIEGGSVYILARGDASAAIDMLIGDLTVTGPSAGSTIENSEGILTFATGDIDGETPSGVIRVVGDLVATGFGLGNAIEFYADRFELDAATGSISLTSSGGALSGELGLNADQIHVAEGSILDQLAVDPQYAGYQDDLNAPAAVQRPEGVLNASVIWIESDNLQNILIQNTGTEEIPAGFLANEVFVNDDFEIAGPPGSIDVVVNGQLQTEGGTLTGFDVRDALVEGEDLSPFTANSTINGCLLTGACAGDSPFPPGFTPTPGIQQEFVLINLNLLPPPEFGNESFIDDNVETTNEGETSPIQPPAPLFDTSPLGDEGDVDDPVSGSGNPALMETPPACNEDEQSSCEEKQP